MSNLMSERKARRLRARIERDNRFLAQHALVCRRIENACIDRRAAFARHLDEAESTLKEQSHGARTRSYYVYPDSSKAPRPTAKVGGR